MPIVWRYYFIFSLNEKFTLALVCMNKLHGRGGDMEFALSPVCKGAGGADICVALTRGVM